jgi:O-antigen/teichoic acid export membrane protein
MLQSDEPDEPMVKRLARNSAWNVASLIVALVLGFVTTPIALSLLGTSRYGLMVILTAVLFPLGLTTLNLGQATIKYVAESYGRSDLEQAGAYLRTALLFSLVVGITGMVVLMVLTDWLTSSVFNIVPSDRDLAREVLCWLAIGWVVGQVIGTFSGVPAAFQRYDLTAMGRIGYSLFSAAFSIGILYLTRDLARYVQTRVVCQALSLIVWVIMARRLLPGVRLRPGWDREAFRRCFRFGFWQTLGQAGGIAATQADKYVLGISLSTEAVGLYNVAMTVQTQAYALGMKFGEVLFPVFSYQSAANDRQREAMMLMRSTWLLTTLSAGIMVPVFVLAGDFLQLWVGPVVASGSAPVLRVLAVAGLLGSASNAGVFYLLGVGKTEWSALLSAATGATVLLGSLLLVPRLGLAGAGWGNVAAMFVQSGIVIHMWRRLFRGIMPARVYLSALYGPTAVGLIMGGTMLGIRLAMQYPLNWATFVVSAIVCGSLTVLPIILVDRILPGGTIRFRDVVRLTRPFLAQQRRKVAQIGK